MEVKISVKSKNCFFVYYSANAISNVYLSNNGLTTISFSLLPWDKIDTIKLDGNPWNCDCSLSWIVSKKKHNLSSIDYNDYLTCNSPEDLRELPIKHLSAGDFGCSK